MRLLMTDVILLDAPDTHTKKRQVMCDMIQTAAKHYGREEREGLREEWEFCDFLSCKAATHGKQNTSGRGQKGPWGSFRHHSAELDLTHKGKKQHRRSVHGKASTLPLMPCSIKTHFPHPASLILKTHLSSKFFYITGGALEGKIL